MLCLESKVIQEAALPNIGLHIPSIMPDEFHLGYFGRFALINGFTDQKEADTYLKNHFSGSILDHPYNFLALKLAKLLNVLPENFIKNHTLVPLLRSPGNSAKNNHHLDVISSLGNRLIQPHVNFCEKCIHEDVDYWGFSFWRRFHQLPGVGTCSKHNENLCRVSQDNAIYAQPSLHLKQQHFIRNETGVKDAANPYVTKFMELVNDFMDMNSNINNYALAQLLAVKAKELNLRIHETGNRNVLSDLIIEKYPSNWIKLHFPTLQLKQNGEFSHEFDRVLIPGKHQTITKILLAISVLIPDADSSILSYAQYIKPVTKPKKTVLNDNQMIDTYVSHKGNIQQISAEVNRKTSKLSEKLKSLGCPALGNIDKETISALNAFLNGASLADVMRDPDVNMEVFSEILRVSGTHVKKAINSSPCL